MSNKFGKYKKGLRDSQSFKGILEDREDML